MVIVLVGVSLAVIKHHDPKPLGEERVYFILQFRVPSLNEVRVGTRGKNLKAETGDAI